MRASKSNLSPTIQYFIRFFNKGSFTTGENVILRGILVGSMPDVNLAVADLDCCCEEQGVVPPPAGQDAIDLSGTFTPPRPPDSAGSELQNNLHADFSATALEDSSKNMQSLDR